MASMGILDTVYSASPNGSGRLRPVARAFKAFRHRIEKRRIVVKLSSASPHLIRDKGFDPQRIYDALDDSWDKRPCCHFPDV